VEKKMRISANIVETNDEINTMILEIMADHINDTLNIAMPKITTEIKELVALSLREEPEYQSLLSGRLRAEFGLSDTNMVDNIIDKLVSTIDVSRSTVSYNKIGLVGGFTITMMKSDDMNGLIFTDIASVISNNGQHLPWLQWLLLEGNNAIVKNFDVKMGSYSQSRSGMAIMVSSRDNWRVPPEFVGTISNNWTTRAIDRIEDKIDILIENIIGALI
jgi:hypothetical protein